MPDEPRTAEDWFNQGCDLRDAGHLEQALGSYRRAVELSPNDAMFISGVGTTLSALGEVEAAVECFRRALELDERYVLAAVNLAHAYMLLQRPSDAPAALELVLRHTPGDVDAFHNYACAAARLEDRAGAFGWAACAVAFADDRDDEERSLAEDDDLRSLRGDPAFMRIVDDPRARDDVTIDAIEMLARTGHWRCLLVLLQREPHRKTVRRRAQRMSSVLDAARSATGADGADEACALLDSLVGEEAR